MAATQTFVPNQLYDIPLADLQADPNQPRKYLDPTLADIHSSNWYSGISRKGIYFFKKSLI